MFRRAFFWGFLAVVLAVTGVGCSGKSDSAADDEPTGGGNPAERQALLDLYRELFRVQCEFDERCASENGRAYVNLQACFAYVEYLMSVLEVGFDEVDFEEYLAVVPGDYRACAESIYPTDTCDAPDSDVLSPQCEAILRYDNPLAVGDVCYVGAEGTGLCTPGSTCSIAGGCGYCEINSDLPDGAACENSTDCASERCNGICVTPQPRGAACTTDIDCRGYLRCNGTAGAMTCNDALGNGAPCSYDSECMNGLGCLGAPAVCTLDVPEGTACDRSGEVGCGYVCVFPSPTAPTGQCGAALPRAGEACAYVGYSPLCLDGYPKSTVGTEGFDTACVCAPLEQGGGPCRAATDCESYSCIGYDPLDPNVIGTCDPLLPLGGDCFTDTNCASGVCIDSICAAAPVCG